MSELATVWADSFDRFARSLPAADAACSVACSTTLSAATGLPGPADEAWHYTDLKRRWPRPGLPPRPLRRGRAG